MKKKGKLKCFIAAPLELETKQIRDVIQDFDVDTWDAFDLSPRPGLTIGEESKKKLASSDFVVGVISKASPNVFYEVGLAQGLGKPVFLIILGKASPPEALSGIGYTRVTERDFSPLRAQFSLFLESLRRRQKRPRYTSESLDELRGKLDTEPNLGEIRSWVNTIASSSKDVAHELVEKLDFDKLKTKLMAEQDPKAVLSCISAIAYVNEEVANQLVEEFGAQKARSIMLVMLKDRYAKVRATAANYLAKFVSPNDLPLIRQMLGDVSWNVRRAAVEALGKIGSAEDIYLIEDMLKDEDYQVRKATIRTLKNTEPFALRKYLAEVEHLRKAGDEREIAKLVAELLNNFVGGCTIFRGVEGRRVDMAVWVDSLEPVWGNPAFVELLYGTLSKNKLAATQRQMHSYLSKTNAKAGLILYLDKTGKRFTIEESLSPNILFIELSDFVRDLGELTFEEIVVRQRNALVHRRGHRDGPLLQKNSL